MDEVKIGEILMPGDEATQDRRERQVRTKFWPTLKRAVRQVPFSRDLIAAYYCAIDRKHTDPGARCSSGGVGIFRAADRFYSGCFVVVGFTDDIAVLAAALRMIQGHITDRHYDAADAALSDNPDLAGSKRA